MKRGKLFQMTRKDLESLSTKRLLARLKKLRQCEESVFLSDREVKVIDPYFIEFKESPQWRLEYDCLKEILSKREHIHQKNNLERFIIYQSL